MNNLHHFLEVITYPFFISFLCLALSILWLLVRGDSYKVRFALVLSLSGLWLFSTGWLPSKMTYALEKQYNAVSQIDTKVRWVVVFGGGHYTAQTGMPAHGELAPVSLSRLIEGVRLYRHIPNAKLILSGGPSSTNKAETDAAYLATVALWFNIPPSDIVLEPDSSNTADEAIAIKKLVGKEPFYLVTSAVHMPRSMALCRHQGLHPIAAPIGYSFYWNDPSWEKVVLPNYINLSHAGAAWHEILGLTWGRICGLL
jgi:uncharacterized SAM-binding protein YcdF (DUF218 family)